MFKKYFFLGTHSSETVGTVADLLKQLSVGSISSEAVKILNVYDHSVMHSYYN